jgi:hypothetical protein
VSEYGYLLCLDDREFIWLGKAIKNDDDKFVYFKVGADDPQGGPYVEIGDDSNTDLTFDECLKGWPDRA